jgi:hypothetical protein
MTPFHSALRAHRSVRHRTALLLRRTIDAVEQVVLTAGAVLGAAELLRHAGAPLALTCMVALVAGSYLLAAVWLSTTGPWRGSELALAGWWLGAIVMLTTFAGTSTVLYFQFLVTLAALFPARLGLQEALSERFTGPLAVGESTAPATPSAGRSVRSPPCPTTMGV